MIEFGVETNPQGIGIVTPKGRLNMVSARRLKEILSGLVDEGTTRIVVDMAETTFLDSSGLGALIAGLKSARQAGGDLRIARPTPSVTTVFALTNLDKVLRARATVEERLRCVKPSRVPPASTTCPGAWSSRPRLTCRSSTSSMRCSSSCGSAIAEVSVGDRGRFETAVIEVLGNIVEHAYQLDPEAPEHPERARRFVVVLRRHRRRGGRLVRGQRHARLPGPQRRRHAERVRRVRSWAGAGGRGDRRAVLRPRRRPQPLEAPLHPEREADLVPRGARLRARRVVMLSSLLLLLVLGYPRSRPPTRLDRPPRPPPPADRGSAPPWTSARTVPWSTPTGWARAASLYTFPVDYPLTDEGVDQLRLFAADAATQGAALVLQVEPTVPLHELPPPMPPVVGRAGPHLNRELDTVTLVRFAPEMNGSWRGWGQQPEAYVAAFRGSPRPCTPRPTGPPWSGRRCTARATPSGASRARTARSTSRPRGRPDLLDTNGSGRVDAADDPYGPYYPGDDAVDWAGLFLYRFGQSQGVEENVAPPAGELAARLAETWGTAATARRASFYDRFADGRDQPMLLETSALYNPAVGGVDELRLKRTWWREVLAALPSHPPDRCAVVARAGPGRARGRRPAGGLAGGPHAGPGPRPAGRPPARGRPPRRARQPDPRPADREQATAQGRIPPASQIGSSTGWVVLCVVLLAVVFLLSGLVGRLVPSWRYVGDPGTRDLRVDLFRGWLILTVVITHTELAGLYSYVTLNGVGAITGAEGFVMLSGRRARHDPRAARAARRASGRRRWCAGSRARKIYLTALVLTCSASTCSGWSPASTPPRSRRSPTAAPAPAGPPPGAGLRPLRQRAAALRLPAAVVRRARAAALDMGPWVLNVLGLFVVLTAVMPAAHLAAAPAPVVGRAGAVVGRPTSTPGCRTRTGCPPSSRTSSRC